MTGKKKENSMTHKKGAGGFTLWFLICVVAALLIGLIILVIKMIMSETGQQVIVAAGAALISILTFIITKQYELRLSIGNDKRAKMVSAYEKSTTNLLEYFLTKDKANKDFNFKDLTANVESLAFQVILWGGENSRNAVMEFYAAWELRHTKADAPADRFFYLIKCLRSDIGIENG